MNTATTTAQHLRTIATGWADLRAALATTPTTWPPTALRAYLTALELHDTAAGQLRALERDPAQIGHTAAPLSIPILDTMRTVEAALVELADQAAAALQRPPMGRAPETWPIAERERRNRLAAEDAADPRRWGAPGRRRTAPHAALWLLAVVEGRPGPWTPLTAAQRAWIHRIAAEAARRIETALDLHDGTAALARPCTGCGGQIIVHGGAGARPLARCRGCGDTWHAPEHAVA
ncbi:hypothetical protein [Streptomyces sp. DH12]|uniref:hypothetical protein n=1 Tax=Streptomyces sp. DH12 TaxID=2857010 RepID=UPI001E4E0CE9|nr:hypothetical protein [Streptomyces sp. DH12]